jgi:hypothetical protein
VPAFLTAGGSRPASPGYVTKPMLQMPAGAACASSGSVSQLLQRMCYFIDRALAPCMCSREISLMVVSWLDEVNSQRYLLSTLMLMLCLLVRRRHQGTAAAGRLLPPSTGRVLNAALAQQQQQLSELQSLLASTAAVVATQAAQITRLQDSATDSRQQQQQQEPGVGRAHLLVSRGAAEVQQSGRVTGSDNTEAERGVGQFLQGLALAYDLQEEGPHTARVSAPDPASSSSSSVTKGSKWLNCQPVTQQHAGAAWRPDSAAARAAHGISSSSRPASTGSYAAGSLRSSWNSSPSKGNLPSSSIRSSSVGRARPMTASAAVRPTGSLSSAADTQQRQQQQQRGVAVGSGGTLVGLGEDVGAGSSGRRTPPANLPKRRPTTAGGVGMLACLRSDLEAWRAK